MGMNRLRKIEKEISGERKITIMVRVPFMKIGKFFKSRYLKWLAGKGVTKWK